MRIASSIVMVPVPLSVAPLPASHESRCAESITYSFGFSVPFDARDGVEHRRLGRSERRLGDGVDARMLAVRRQTREQRVVLARDVERRDRASLAPTGSCRRPSRETTSSRARQRRRRARVAREARDC